MIRPAPADERLPAAVRRLARIAPLGEDDRVALLAAVRAAAPVRAGKELAVAGTAVLGPRLIVGGWAARVRILADGRRQFIGFLLPGDLIDSRGQPRPLAGSTIVALTDVAVCSPPLDERSQGLRDAYATGHAMDEAYLVSHIVRLGRLSAYEKIADLLLEFDERLELAGLATAGSFAIPMTQEVLGDALGLTSVHVNRMVQQLRRNGDLVWSDGEVRLTDPSALARRVGRQRVRVSR